MAKRMISFGVIGCGLMGREFASAAARWCHLQNLDFQPQIVAACDANPQMTDWFAQNVPSIKRTTTDYQELLNDDSIEAIYCAVPHHLHSEIYGDILRAGKHLLGEKPFGIDQAANQKINAAIQEHPQVLARCSSEFPFYPGAFRLQNWIKENRFGRIIEVEAGFWHSSDLDPKKPINWKRRIATNGEYGCMGDLGLHVLHLPLRYGWKPKNVRALLSKIVAQRPDGQGQMANCETWDNAILACEVETESQRFPMTLSTKRIAPGHANTWFLRVWGTEFSAQFSTQNPKQIQFMPYQAGDEQAWRTLDMPYQSAYETITGGIFEFGFSDSILQMWAAFCDEITHGDDMIGVFRCALPSEAALSHEIFSAALQSQREGQTVKLT